MAGNRVNFKLDTNVDNWLVSFHLVAGHPKVRFFHTRSCTVLVAPADSDQMNEIVPFEQWPAFAHSLIQSPPPPSQEGLFES